MRLLSFANTHCLAICAIPPVGYGCVLPGVAPQSQSLNLSRTSQSLGCRVCLVSGSERRARFYGHQLPRLGVGAHLRYFPL